jgi:hypothetical protein
MQTLRKLPTAAPTAKTQKAKITPGISIAYASYHKGHKVHKESFPIVASLCALCVLCGEIQSPQELLY